MPRISAFLPENNEALPHEETYQQGIAVWDGSTVPVPACVDCHQLWPCQTALERGVVVDETSAGFIYESYDIPPYEPEPPDIVPIPPPPYEGP